MRRNVWSKAAPFSAIRLTARATGRVRGAVRRRIRVRLIQDSAVRRVAQASRLYLTPQQIRAPVKACPSNLINFPFLHPSILPSNDLPPKIHEDTTKEIENPQTRALAVGGRFCTDVHRPTECCLFAAERRPNKKTKHRLPARFAVIDLWSRQQRGVDDVDHTVRLNDVGDADRCRITPDIR